MTSTMIDAPAPAPSPRPRPATDAPLRFVTLRADLLPDEILDARQSLIMRKRVLVGLAVLVVILIGWFGLARWQTSSAGDDLDTVKQDSVALAQEQARYAPLVRAQDDVKSIDARLRTLMAGDLPWQRMLSTLRADAPRGVTLTNVTGSVTTGVVTSSGVTGTTNTQAQPDVLNQTGSRAVGTLTITGTAPTKASVAGYADRLAKSKGLAAPLISSVTVANRAVTFTMNVLITTNALGGRYSGKAGN